jgi:hypothetical protein
MTVTLQKITVEFVHEQDRIRLTGEKDGGGQVVIWLTRRLLGFMLPVLLEHLDSEFVAAIPQHREVLQEFAQQAARATLGGAAPVTVEKVDEAMLASAVDMSRIKEGVLLTFRNGPDSGYRLPLSLEALRQWLHILYQADQKAAWRLPQWPGWLSGAQAPDTGHPMH